MIFDLSKLYCLDVYLSLFIISVLLIMSFNLLYLYHFSIFIKVFKIKCVSSILLSAVKVIAVSSSYTVYFVLLSFKYNGRSLT